MNLNDLSIAQLENLIVEAQSIIQQKKVAARKTLIADMEKLARDAGVSLSELFGENGAISKDKKSGAKVAAKYQNPNDPSQKWSGRGRQPLWVAALLASGKRLEDLAV